MWDSLKLMNFAYSVPAPTKSLARGLLCCYKTRLPCQLFRIWKNKILTARIYLVERVWFFWTLFSFPGNLLVHAGDWPNLLHQETQVVRHQVPKDCLQTTPEISHPPVLFRYRSTLIDTSLKSDVDKLGELLFIFHLSPRFTDQDILSNYTHLANY